MTLQFQPRARMFPGASWRRARDARRIVPEGNRLPGDDHAAPLADHPSPPGRPEPTGPIRQAVAVLALGMLMLGPTVFPAAAAGPEEIRFSRDVLPLLSDHCFSCHGPDEKGRQGGLRLDTLEGARGAGKSGQVAVVPGRPAESELLRRVLNTDPDDRMPPPRANKPLSAAQVDLLRRWIEGGAPWGRHWAFEPPVRPTPPAVQDPAWPRQPLDAFVLARLEREGLAPAPEAAPATLVRRVSLDLTGLPPSPDAADGRAGGAKVPAYEQWVDRLLASPRFGERMAWEWLEAARYADSNGYQGDGERTMWPWRDWVVEAFNRNLPFDQFTLWQLAGDRLPDATFETRLATGFLRNHMINGEGGRIAEENRIDYLFDQTETVATVWLGATFNCTRCHDHKYDPYTQRDYFGLLDLFNRTAVDGGGGNPQTPPHLAIASAPQQRELSERRGEVEALAAELQQLELGFREAIGEWESDAARQTQLREALAQPVRDRGDERLQLLAAAMEPREPAYANLLKTYRERRSQWHALEGGLPRVMVMEDRPEKRPTPMLEKGLYNKTGELVEANTPAGFTPLPGDGPADRRQLARWLLEPQHPLTARVTVNRHWQAFFGNGLVRTPEDFGIQGER
ncbi:MAG: DUF1549 domain-containing protein, partial [Verrucomicrobiota bacterium]